jgi:hypothetical protein
MPTPIIETFAAALKTRLETITTGSDYNYSPTVVRRVKRSDDPAHLQIRILQPDREPVEGAEDRSEWIQPFQIRLVVMPPDGDAVPLDTYRNLFAADVEKCLDIDAQPAWWSTIAGIVQCTLDGPFSFDEEADYDGCEFILNCHYRHVRGDPFTA